jgi:hypothetical protein
MRQSILLKSFIVIVAGVAVVGGAIFVGFRHASDVQGEGDVHAGEPGPYAAAGTPADQVRAYMLSLRADDYTTYTHPVFGFMGVPKAGLTILRLRMSFKKPLERPTLIMYGPIGLKIS